MDLTANLLEADPTSVNKQRIYTTGYEGREVTDLPGLLTRLDALLIDIRFSPPERPLKWRKDYLKLLLRKRYLHVPVLGNRAQNEPNKIAIFNLSLGIKIITNLKVNLLLMCSCQSEENCHRRIISNELKKQGIQAEEIRDWKDPIRVR